MTSSRLPGKVLADIGGLPALELMVKRLAFVADIDAIVIATTVNAIDDPVATLAGHLGVGLWRGSEEDVLQRVLDAAMHHDAEVIVELTGDCPLIDPAIVSRVIRVYREAGADYVSNALIRSYPIGMDTQVFATHVLADVAKRTRDPLDREHVSLFIYRNPGIYLLANVEAPGDETRPNLRLTLDTKEDLAVIRAVHEALRSEGINYPLSRMLRFLEANPGIAAANAAVAHRWV
jgi:spore coat polysaccharide biosynthesis protein SpsF